MADRGYSCQRCGRTFTGMRATAYARIVLTALGGAVLVLALTELAMRGPLVPGMRFASLSIVLPTVFGLVAVNVVARHAVGAGKRRYSTAEGMMCPSCQAQLPEEKGVADQRGAGPIEGVGSDVLLNQIMEEWMAVHDDPAPDRDTVARIRTALCQERAGDLEGAAQIYEEEGLGALARWVRGKGRT